MVAQGHKREDCNRITVTISIPPEDFEAIKNQALIEQRSLSNMIVILAKRGLKTKE